MQLFFSLPPSSEKMKHKVGVNFFSEKLTTSRDGPVKSTEQGRDENTRRLFLYRKFVVKKDWKTTLLLLPDYATDVEQSSSLSLP